jgi:hypothetical protein
MSKIVLKTTIIVSLFQITIIGNCLFQMTKYVLINFIFAKEQLIKGDVPTEVMKTDAVGRVLSSVNSQLDGISYNLCYAYH